MKAYKYLAVLFLAIIVIFSSCKKEDDDIFEEEASVRVERMQNELLTTLTSSEQGWIFNYYPQPEKYGGFNFLIKFAPDGTCDMRGDMFWGDEVVPSKYSTNISQGICLNFDTYGLLTKLADPSLNVTAEGWNGEQEFVYLRMSADKDTIYFRGKKKGFETSMYKNKEDWNTYFDRLNGHLLSFTSGDANRYFRTLDFGGLKTEVSACGYTLSKRTMNFYYHDENQQMQNVNAKVLFTSEGFEFLEPVVIDGYSFQKFNYEESTDKFVCMDSKAQGAYFIPSDDFGFTLGNVTERFMRGIYVDEFYEEHSDNYILKEIPFELQTLWNQITAKIPSYYNTSIYAMSDGKGGYEYYFMISYIEGNYLNLGVAAPISPVKDLKNKDRITFNFGIFSSIVGDYASAVKADFRQLCTELFGKKTYIVTPSSDYKSFDLGATNSGNYLIMNQW